jgi:hypothetical protein
MKITDLQTLKIFSVSLISSHALTEDKHNEYKEKFYQMLGKKIYHQIQSNDIQSIIGDLNAQTCQEDVSLGITGKHSMHKETNDDGMKLI